jgi:hypothetical protein
MDRRWARLGQVIRSAEKRAGRSMSNGFVSESDLNSRAYNLRRDGIT